MRRILTMRCMLRIGRLQRMRGDTKDGENIQGRILRMRGDTKDGKNSQGRIMRMERILKVIVSRNEYVLKA
jgi:hypothetical protein